MENFPWFIANSLAFLIVVIVWLIAYIIKNDGI
jgi:hypothetical protein